MTDPKRCAKCGKLKCKQPADSHQWPQMLNPEYCRASMCHGDCHASPAPPTAEPTVTQPSGEGIGLGRCRISDDRQFVPGCGRVHVMVADDEDGEYYYAPDVDSRWAEREREYWRLHNYTAVVLERLTGGRISQPFTDLCAVETECEEAYTKDLEAEHAAALAAKDAEITRLAESVAWGRRRLDLLQQQQRQMRDPERTMVCDILANGALLPDPNGTRYREEPK